MSTAAHDVPEDEWLLTVPEAVAALRISRSHFFKLKRRGVIETVKLGSRTVVPRREITRLIDEALSGSVSAPVSADHVSQNGSAKLNGEATSRTGRRKRAKCSNKR